MATVKTKYLNNLRCESTHLQSGTSILTDAPTDNNGKGEAFSPTDLLATALANCMLTIMGITANNHQFSIEGTSIDVTKIMASNPRRVDEVIVAFSFKQEFTEKQQKLLMAAAKSCPVALSLSAELKQTVKFNWN